MEVAPEGWPGPMEGVGLMLPLRLPTIMPPKDKLLEAWPSKGRAHPEEGGSAIGDVCLAYRVDDVSLPVVAAREMKARGFEA